jgi:hypothetical protein
MSTEIIYYKNVVIGNIDIKPREGGNALGKDFDVFYLVDGRETEFKFMCDVMELPYGIQLEYQKKGEKAKADKDKYRGFQFGSLKHPITKDTNGKYKSDDESNDTTIELFDWVDKVNDRLLECVKRYKKNAFIESKTIRSAHEKEVDEGEKVKPENYMFNGRLAGTGADNSDGTAREKYECWTAFKNKKGELMSVDAAMSVSKQARVYSAVKCGSIFVASKNSSVSIRYTSKQFKFTVYGTKPGVREIEDFDFSSAKRARIDDEEKDTEVDDNNVTFNAPS